MSKQTALRKYFSIYMALITVGLQLMYFAQAYKVFSTKSASDLSLFAFVVAFISNVSWLWHGIVVKDYPLIVFGVLSSITAALITCGVIFYG